MFCLFCFAFVVCFCYFHLLVLPNIVQHYISIYQRFYIDDDGNPQGPFTSTQILEWYNAQFFQSDLKIQPVQSGAQPDSTKYVTLDQHFDQKEAENHKNDTDDSIQTEQKDSIEQEADDGYDSDDQYIPDDILENTIPSTTHTNSNSTSISDSASKDNNVLSTSLTPIQWYYVDDNGETQGPFTTESMKAWNDAGCKHFFIYLLGFCHVFRLGCDFLIFLFCIYIFVKCLDHMFDFIELLIRFSIQYKSA